MSFAKAAEELFVTPAALSYQIKTLEEHLGRKLFTRLNRAVELTEAGRVLQPGVAEGFARLAEAVRALERLDGDAALTITAGPGFTAKWLAPRFFGFVAGHPEIELRFVASLKILDFDRDGVDAAIRFGGQGDPALYCEALIDEWVVPVATPERALGLARPGDLLRAPLIHDDSIDFLRPRSDWPAWFRTLGVPDPEGLASRGPRFSNADHAVDAALEGAGVALGRASLIERDLSSGRLVAPIGIGLKVPGKYRFMCKKGAETTPRIATLLDWLRRETATTNAFGEAFELRDPVA